MQMPSIRWPETRFEEPPANKDFLDVKLKHLEDLLFRLRPYVGAVMNLNGMQGREDIRDVIWFVLREFAVYFWDLPASRNYHHSGRWGLLSHSLEVALGRADEASRRVAVDSEGNPSAEAGRKHRGEQVLIAWLSGLLHDSGKITDMELKYSESDRDINFHPLRGTVLGFKLKHPERNLNLRWLDNRGMRHVKHNLAMLMCIAPLGLIKQFRQDQLIALFDGLAEDGDTADHESVAADRAEQDAEYIRQAVKLFARDNFRAKDNQGRTQPRVFALGQNTYAMVNPVAMEALSGYIRNELGAESFAKEQVIAHLVRSRLIYSSDEDETSGNYFVKLAGYLKKVRINFHIIFAHGDLFADADVSSLPVLKIEDSGEAREKIRRITGFDPPEQWFCAPQEKT